MADNSAKPSSISAPPPTSEAIAVAVKQDKRPEQTPTVIAGGRGRVAEQILEIAFAQGIKVREDADLAQMLSAVDVDSEIPLEAFATVAEILTYVYEANDAMKPDRGPDPLHAYDAPRRPNAGEMVNKWSSDERDKNE